MLLFWGHKVPDFLTFPLVEWFKQPTIKAAAGVTLCPGAACPAASECASHWRHGQSVAKSGLYRSCTTTSLFAPVPLPLSSCAGDGWWCLQGTWTCHLHVPEHGFSVGCSSMALPCRCPWASLLTLMLTFYSFHFSPENCSYSTYLNQSLILNKLPRSSGSVSEC